MGEILIFAIIAVALAHRLWTVLGRRDGETPPLRPDPFARANPAQLGAGVRPASVTEGGIVPAIDSFPDQPLSLEATLARVKTLDANFDEKSFLAGAKTAFSLIVKAYVQNDRAALKPLLSEDVYKQFESAITEREASQHSLENNILSVTASMDHAEIVGNTVRLTVGFVSKQINVTRDQAGTVVDGDPKEVADVRDIWTFARDTRVSDPNWLLIATRE